MNKTQPDPYKNLIDLLAVYSEAKNRLAALESTINGAYLDMIDEAKPNYAHMQSAVTDAEAAIKEMVAMHPEWFADAKTVKTPFGAVHSQTTKSHEAPNAGLSIARIKAAQARAIKAGDEVWATQLGAMIRVEESLNLEALGEVDLAVLATLGIVRRVEESVTIKEAKVSLGQAVKAATKRAAKATLPQHEAQAA